MDLSMLNVANTRAAFPKKKNGEVKANRPMN